MSSASNSTGGCHGIEGKTLPISKRNVRPDIRYPIYNTNLRDGPLVLYHVLRLGPQGVFALGRHMRHLRQPPRTMRQQDKTVKKQSKVSKPKQAPLLLRQVDLNRGNNAKTAIRYLLYEAAC